ncbi:MAG TPA: methionine--tRNA ligase subunit beta [Oligoflexia bacterium]|nr:methionine--tRNA ligase subunit beta [Oligoflexia bacterium]HMP47285.1 methionine--tRNA ligase subunit beta [Oligoflexia bacterium]
MNSDKLNQVEALVEPKGSTATVEAVNEKKRNELAESIISLNEISYDDFAKVHLKIGIIESAERIEKSEKLLKLRVNLGEDRGPRQILAGIAKYYSPESLIGKRIVVVANLKPAKLMGQLSEGMLLAASNTEGHLELLNLSEVFKGGETVR